MKSAVLTFISGVSGAALPAAEADFEPDLVKISQTLIDAVHVLDPPCLAHAAWALGGLR